MKDYQIINSAVINGKVVINGKDTISVNDGDIVVVYGNDDSYMITVKSGDMVTIVKLNKQLDIILENEISAEELPSYDLVSFLVSILELDSSSLDCQDWY